MLFSVFYRIQNRDKFFTRFCNRYIKITDGALRESMVDTCEELMELIVKMILDSDKRNLTAILAKQNSKNARIFFDYITGSKTKHMKKQDIIKAVDEYFKKENEMKNISDFLCEAVKPVKLTEFKYKPFKLTEADDDADFGETDAGGDDADFGDAGGDDDFGGGDDFGDDFGGDMGGDDADPFGDDAGGDTDGGDNSDTDAATGEDNPDDPYDIEGHEDDPDFTKGQTSGGDLGEPVPAGACVYDAEGIFKSIDAVVQSLPDLELAEIDAVKKAVTLIFNGKILNPEDVTFQNPKNAMYLVKKIGENVDERTCRYLFLKIKQPLIKLRDARKEELAKMKNDTQNIRNTLSAIDK